MFSANSSQVSNDANYIEDVFSTYLYTGNGSTQTITNGIDLAGKGGLVWIKTRSDTGGVYTGDHVAHDTARGVNKTLRINSTAAQSTRNGVTAFNADGFTTGGLDWENRSGMTYASWTFRKQPKFFDVVTYTGDGGVNGDSNSTRSISHSLGSQPGMVIIKRTDSTSNWYGVHRNDGTNNAVWASVNLSNACTAGLSQAGYNAYITSTTFNPFYIRDSLNQTPLPNVTGATYVAYLFAHNAGGFGLTGTDNVISCGSYTAIGGGTPQTITLGYEPQWVLVKSASAVNGWYIFDSMRGMSETASAGLTANTSNAESSLSPQIVPKATGFTSDYSNVAGEVHIYIAIRRGPMKVPTSGTSVFSPISSSASVGTYNTTGFPIDLQINTARSSSGYSRADVDRLRGISTTSTQNDVALYTNFTNSEDTAGGNTNSWDNTGFKIATNLAGRSSIYWNFRRAPSFFDEVCYTGDGTTSRVINHNLGVAPELIIKKERNSASGGWNTQPVGPLTYTSNLTLDTTNANTANGQTYLFYSGTSTTLTTGSTATYINNSGTTYVVYLFATCAGVSKVGSYTGTGTTKQIDCGFTGGARFVLIKRTDSTGDWYVWDTARGIVSGNDPYLLLNSTAAETTGTDYIDTYSAGFEISSTAPAAINASGGTFIFLAIA